MASTNGSGKLNVNIISSTNMKMKPNGESDSLPSVLRLNLACGNQKKEGWVGVDICQAVSPDVVLDLSKHPWPWPDSSIEEIYTSHFVEHLDDTIGFMDECWRVLKPDAKMTVLGPYYTSVRCWQDPTHRKALSEMLFFYFSADFRKTNGVEHYPIRSNFRLLGFKYHYPPHFRDKTDEELDFLRAHAWNIVTDFETEMQAIK